MPSFVLCEHLFSCTYTYTEIESYAIKNRIESFFKRMSHWLYIGRLRFISKTNYLINIEQNNTWLFNWRPHLIISTIPGHLIKEFIWEIISQELLGSNILWTWVPKTVLSWTFHHLICLLVLRGFIGFGFCPWRFVCLGRGFPKS